MSLIESMMSPFVLMEKHKTPDGAGGSLTQWLDGMEFNAVITMDTTMDAKIAEQSGVTSIYTVTTAQNVVLDYHDVIKRKSDGKTFRITSDREDKKSPSVATFSIAQVTAERWDLSD